MRYWLILFTLLFNCQLIAELKIGYSLPLTGDIAEYGVACQNGVLLAQEDNTDKFQDIKISYQDNKYNASEAVKILQKFIRDEQDLIFSWGELPLSAIAPIVERKKIPVVAMSFDAEPSKSSRYIIRSVNAGDDFAKHLLNFYQSDKFTDKHQKIGLIKTEDPFFNSMTAGLKNHLGDDQILEVLANFLPHENDFKSVITKINQKRFDILGVYLFPGQVSTFYRTAKANGLKINSFGTDIFDSTTEIKNAAGSMEKAIFPSVVVPDEFKKRYLTKFGNDIQITFAYNTYVFTNYLTYLSEKLKSNQEADIISLLSEAPANFSYPVKFKSNQDFGMYYDFPIEIKQIIGLKTQVIGK